MNVNPRSAQFGEIKPLDALTEAERASGDWIELPDVAGEPRRARKRSAIDTLFSTNRAPTSESSDVFPGGRR